MIKSPRVLSLPEAVNEIQDGERLVLGHAAVVPHIVIEELVRVKERFTNLHIYHLICMGEPLHVVPGMEQHFKVSTSFMVGRKMQEAVQSGRASYVPAHFSRIPALFEKNAPLHPDWAIVQVTPPNEKGHYSLSLSADYTQPAAKKAKKVLAIVNDQLPYIYGENYLTAEEIDIIVEHSAPPYEVPLSTPNEVEKQIASYCAELIPNGATLQIGIGAIPDAVLALLTNRKELGIHTELLTPGVKQLFEAGAITNQKKGVNRGKLLGTFVMGNKELYQWLNNNEYYEQYPVNYVNSPQVIGKNPNMISINSCVEVNLYGEVCSEKVMGKMYSGSGGQFDYVRGVEYSQGGKSILAFPSTAAGGKVSRIAPLITRGNVITTHRNDVDYLVTEYGVAQLTGKTELERAKALIKIAHPQFRDELEASLKHI